MQRDALNFQQGETLTAHKDHIPLSISGQTEQAKARVSAG